MRIEQEQINKELHITDEHSKKKQRTKVKLSFACELALDHKSVFFFFQGSLH